MVPSSSPTSSCWTCRCTAPGRGLRSCACSWRSVPPRWSSSRPSGGGATRSRARARLGLRAKPEDGGSRPSATSWSRSASCCSPCARPRAALGRRAAPLRFGDLAEPTRGSSRSAPRREAAGARPAARRAAGRPASRLPDRPAHAREVHRGLRGAARRALARSAPRRPRTAIWSRPGRVLVAPGGRHLEVAREAGGALRAVIVRAGAPAAGEEHPSVDRLFTSVAHAPRAARLRRRADGDGAGRAGRRAGGEAARWPHARRVAGERRGIRNAPGARRGGALDRLLPLDGIAQRIAASGPGSNVHGAPPRTRGRQQAAPCAGGPATRSSGSA